MNKETKIEEKKSFYQRRKKEIVLTLVAVVIVAGITFAWLRRTINSNEKNVLVSGKLRLTIMNEDPIIKAGGEDGYAMPMADEYGLQTTPYTFTIKNTGNVEAAFELSLTNATSYTERVQATDAYGDAITNQYGYVVYNDVTRYVYYDSNRISDSFIKFNIREGSDTNTTATSLGDTTDRVMFSGTIAAGATKTYYLRLWVSSEAEYTDIEDKVFATSLKLDAIQSGGGASQGSNSGSGNRNSHIKAIYEYNENGSGTGSSYTGCLGGSEAGCTDVKNSYTSSSTYTVGTIIKYEVKAGVEKYFNVLHDDGTTLTMQERQNTVSNVKWYGTSSNNTNVNGPDYTNSGYALYELEHATADWTYVNTQNYSIGNSSSTLGYSRCTSYNTCNATIYSLTRTAKARMITVQELNCYGYYPRTCPRYTWNYLNNANNPNDGYGSSVGSFGTDTNSCYFTMSANTYSNSTRTYYNAWQVLYQGYTSDYEVYSTCGARAVVVINK